MKSTQGGSDMAAKKSLREILATNMRLRRSKLNISQEEFADLCKLHRTYISDVERCNRNISIDNIQRIAEAFNIPASKLLEEDLDENS
ncbi:putative BamHI control element [Oscillibacter valericigenes Sjm18-20]|nr:putative BamHI control element [Oscillibacter valericigenes Sjm18-20]